MASIPNKLLVKDESLFNQALPELYHLLAHQKYELSTIPLDNNLLKFKNNQLERQLFQSLVCDHQDKSNSSSYFSYSLLSFCIFYTGFALVKLVSSVVLYMQQQECLSSLIFQSSVLLILSVFLFGICCLTLKLHSFRMRSRTLFMVFSILVSTYLLLGDQRIYTEFTSYEYNSNHINHMLPILAFIIRFKQLFFNSFKHFLVLVIWTMVMYLALFIYAVPQRKTVTAAEFFILTFFLAIEVIDMNQSEYRMKQVFFRKIKDQEFLSNIHLDPDCFEHSNEDIHSGHEIVVKMCEEVQNNLKCASQISMCPDIREIFKSAFSAVEAIKRRIGKFGIFKDVVLNKHEEIDDEDREFIFQNYIDISNSSASVSSNLKNTHFLDNISMQNIFPFKNYGIEKFEHALVSIGINWNFDIWLIYSASGHSAFIMGKFLMKKLSLNETLNIPEAVSDVLFRRIEGGYEKNPYHNACHAADVLHSMLFFILNSHIVKHINDIDMISCIIAALAHDIHHPGLTNRFLVNTGDRLALEYNDRSVLENMHASKTFLLLNSEDSNIFLSQTAEIYFRARRLILEMILGTDMTKHFNFLSSFRTRAINLADISIDKEEDKTTVLSMALKCADIAHTAKSIELHRKWAELVCEEFFRQGDIEKQKNLSVSMYCDRDSTDVIKSQVGFLKNVCLPLYETWTAYLNSESINMHCLENMRRNLMFWESKCKARRATLQLLKDEDAMRSNSIFVSKRTNRVASWMNNMKDQA